MFRRFSFAFGLLLILAVLLIKPVLAGGWAVITLDQWPDRITAGGTLTVGFTVRQHGIRPMEGLSPTITGNNPDTGDRFTVSAEPEGAIGHYTATLTFPDAGTWDWSIQAFSMDQPMPPLTVIADQTEAGEENSASRAPLPLSLWVGFLGLVVTSAGIVFTLRRSSRWAQILVLAGLIASGAGFVAAGIQSSNPQPVALAAPSLSQEQLGGRLFLAKGCATCHTHQSVPNLGNITVDVGPDLSAFTANQEYLRQWLADPSSVKPNTKMPDLGLSDEEIKALIAFLNSE